MALSYGFIKCKIVNNRPIFLKPTRRRHEIQYHLHVALAIEDDDRRWDTAINVGTNDSDDLLRYKLVFDYRHSLIKQLATAKAGFRELTGSTAMPALDFLRSDVLSQTGRWRDSDVMDGSNQVEPVATLNRLLLKAQAVGADVYIWGRTYKTGGPGIHDVHMNQGSSGGFINDGIDDQNDHNDCWQDGAVLVDLGEPEWAGYFTVFTQQSVPTNDLGNPVPEGHPMGDNDAGSLKRTP